MDCQNCEAVLLDLVYGELASHVQSEARAHLTRCAQCQAVFERLSAGKHLAQQLPQEDPPAGLSQRLMQAARAQPVVQPARRSPFEGWGEVLRRFAFSRQVAMATMMVLILAVGLLALPQLSHRPQVSGVTVVNPEGAGEAAPSAALRSAKPLDLAIDTRTGRIRAKGELDQAASPRPAANAVRGAAAPADVPAAPAAAQVAEPEAYAPPPPAAAPEAPAELAVAAAKLDVPARLAMGAEEAKRAHDALELSGALLGDDELAAPAAEGGGVAAPAVAAQAPAPAAGAGMPRSAKTKARRFAEPPPASSAPAAALLRTARAARSAGHCNQAVTRYRAVVDGYPTSAEAAPALREAAACYDHMGQPALATRMLAQAAHVPALASQASQLLAARARFTP